MEIIFFCCGWGFKSMVGLYVCFYYYSDVFIGNIIQIISLTMGKLKKFSYFLIGSINISIFIDIFPWDGLNFQILSTYS